MSTDHPSRHSQRGSGLLLGLALAAGALFIWARQTDSGLEREIAGLENRRGDLVRLQRDNQDLAAVVARLAALPIKPATPRPKPAVVTPPGFKKLGDLQNVGVATPGGAFESYLWAIDHGEPGELAKVLILSDAARAQVEASFAKLPVAEQQKYGSAEGMFALVYAYANSPRFAALQTGDESPVALNQVDLETKWQFPGGQIREHPIPLYRTAGGWKVIVPDSKVDSIIHEELESEPTAAPPGRP